MVDRVKYFFLDFIGVASGDLRRIPQKVCIASSERWAASRQGEWFLGTKERAPHLYSALANGTLAHAIEMDDVNTSLLSIRVVVFSAALATSEMVGGYAEKAYRGGNLGYESDDAVWERPPERRTVIRGVFHQPHLWFLWGEWCRSDLGIR